MENLPPMDREAELSLVGSMLIDPSVIPGIVAIMGSDEGSSLIFDPCLRVIYEAAVEMHAAGKPIDLTTMRFELIRRKQWEVIGGEEALIGLVESVPSAHHSKRYAEIVREVATLRDLAAACGDIRAAAHTPGADLRAILADAERRLHAITSRRVRRHATTDIIRQALDSVYAEIAERAGGASPGDYATGFQALDDVLGGLRKGEMIVVAGRPSMGKTALCLNVAANLAIRQEIPTLIVSLEMTSKALASRVLFAEAGVAATKARTGMLGRTEWELVDRARAIINESPFLVIDCPGASIWHIMGAVRDAVIQRGVEVVAIDYLQLIVGHRRGKDSRQEEVAGISAAIKALAAELDIPILVAAQLNRGNEQRAGNRPRMSDLRESGSIEQDADVVMLLHREEYYVKHDADKLAQCRGVAEVIIDKHRNGPTGLAKLTWVEEITRFQSYAGTEPQADDPAPAEPRLPYAEDAPDQDSVQMIPF